MKSFQTRLYKILDGSVEEKAARYCEIFIASVVVLNVIAIILESVQELHEAYADFFHIFDVVSVMIFTAEYVLRVWSYAMKYSVDEGGAWRGRKEYIFSFYGFIDFFGTIPFYLQLLFPGLDLRFLRLFRLMRIFKLSRYNSALTDLIDRSSQSRARFLYFGIVSADDLLPVVLFADLHR
jgi:voltage-gated potassium channel